jgi:GGDEF domain-containing protein
MQKGTESSLRPIKDEKLRCKEEPHRMRIAFSRTLESFLELFNSALDGHTLAILKVEGSRFSPFVAHSLSPHFNMKAVVEGFPSSSLAALQQGKPVFFTAGDETLMRFTRLYKYAPTIKSALLVPINAKEPFWLLYLDSLKAYDIHKTKEKLLIQATRFLPKLLQAKPAKGPSEPDGSTLVDLELLANIQKKLEEASGEAALLAALKAGFDGFLPNGMGFILTLPSKALAELYSDVYTFGGLNPFPPESVDMEHSFVGMALSKGCPVNVNLSQSQTSAIAEDICTPSNGYALFLPLSGPLETKGILGVFSASPLPPKEMFLAVHLGKEFLKRLLDMHLVQTLHLKDPYTELLNTLAFEAFVTHMFQKGWPFAILTLRLTGLKELVRVYGYYRVIAFTRAFFQTVRTLQSKETAVFSLGLEELAFVSRNGRGNLDKLYRQRILPLLASLKDTLEKRLAIEIFWQSRVFECPREANTPTLMFKIVYDEKKYC